MGPDVKLIKFRWEEGQRGWVGEWLSSCFYRRNTEGSTWTETGRRLREGLWPSDGLEVIPLAKQD